MALTSRRRSWFSSLFSIDRRLGLRERTAKSQRRRSTQLNLERLEDRTVPTVVVTPYYGPEGPGGGSNEAPVNATPTVMTSTPTVYLIFWGSSWNTVAADVTLKNNMIAAFQTVLSSSFLTVTSQYGTTGQAVYGGAYTDAGTNPPAGYSSANGAAIDNGGVNTSQADMQGEIQNVIATVGSGIPGPTGNNIQTAPIYLVTDPPETSQGNGYNVPGTDASSNAINMISLGTGQTKAGSAVNFESMAFSHELAERVSDPKEDGSGTVFTPPGNLPIPPFAGPKGVTYQNGDGEGDQNYTYRLGGVNGALIQATFSAATKSPGGTAGAWAVFDGNSENLFLTPNWSTGTSFSGNYNLAINGDQLANLNDSITLSATQPTAGGTGLQVNLNGQLFNFDPGVIKKITVNGLTGGNTLTLDFTKGNFLPTGGITYNGGTGPTGSLVLEGGDGGGGGSGFTTEVDTATGLHSGVITLDGKTVTYSNLSPIIDTATAANFFINGTGAAGQTFNVVNDPNGTENGGIATDEVNSNDFEKVDFGDKTNVTVKASIIATLATAGPSTFTVDVLTAALNLSTLTLDGGGNGSTFNVQATTAGFSTTLVGSGTTGDAYNIFSGAGVSSGTLTDIHGLITVKADASTANRLIVSDQGNTTTADTVKVTNAAITVTGGAAATIHYSAVGGGAFTDGAANDGILFLGPNLTGGGNVFNVLSTFAGSSTLVQGGSGSDAFYIAGVGLGADSTTSLEGQGGNNSFDVVSAPPNTAALYIDGGASGANVLAGPDFNETWTLTGYNQGGVGAAVTGFFDVQYLIGGGGDDAFVLSAAASEVSIDGGGGNNTVVGAPNRINAFNVTGGNAGDLQGALGAFVNIENLAGSTQPGATGTDVFLFFPNGGLAGHIAGGTDSEWIDYDPLSMPIYANLNTGGFSRINGGVTHLATSPMNVIGSGVGGDVLIGDASGGVLEAHNSGNTIEAGGGRTIIIGGYGRNFLEGGAADDLIIGGSTVYDYDIMTLTGFLTEWQGAKPFATRVNDLRTGTGQAGGHSLVLNQTVFVTSTPPGPHFGRGGGNGQTTLIGEGGQNWFFTLYSTAIEDLKPTDAVD